MSDGSFEDLLHQPFRWPTAGDRLFAPSTRRLGDALVGSYSLSSQLYGYKLAADLLVEHATVERPDRDLLVYPAIFCYRHYLELSLKMIIQEYGPSVGIEPNWKDHGLEKLWPAVRKVLDDYNVSNDTDDIVAECMNVLPTLRRLTLIPLPIDIRWIGKERRYLLALNGLISSNFVK